MSRHDNRLYTWLIRNMPEGLFEQLVTSGKPCEWENAWVYRNDLFNPLSGASLVQFDYSTKKGVKLTANTNHPSGNDWPLPEFDALHIASLGAPTVERMFVELDQSTILDRYNGRLAGLFTVTQMLTYPTDDPKALLPEELRRLNLIDVTDGLTEAHITSIPDLAEQDARRILAREHVAGATAHDVKMVVLTGDQTVVSSAMDKLREDPWLAANAHFVPQTAQFVIEELLGPEPIMRESMTEQTDERARRYRIERRITLAFEAVSRAQAWAAGKKFLVTNGGTPDYFRRPLDRNFDDFQELFGVHPTEDMGRYHAIIGFKLPTHTVDSSDNGMDREGGNRTRDQLHALALNSHTNFRYAPDEVDVLAPFVFKRIQRP